MRYQGAAEETHSGNPVEVGESHEGGERLAPGMALDLVDRPRSEAAQFGAQGSGDVRGDRRSRG